MQNLSVNSICDPKKTLKWLIIYKKIGTKLKCKSIYDPKKQA